MKTFISDIIPKIQKYSQKIDNLTLLTNKHWVVLDEKSKSRTVFIFRPNNELLIAENGKVEKAKWEYLGIDSILIDKQDGSYLFKHGFFDENILALRVDSKDEYAFFINEDKLNGDLNSLNKLSEFLSDTYLQPTILGVGQNLNNNNTSNNLKLSSVVRGNSNTKVPSSESKKKKEDGSIIFPLILGFLAFIVFLAFSIKNSNSYDDNNSDLTGYNNLEVDQSLSSDSSYSGDITYDQVADTSTVSANDKITNLPLDAAQINERDTSVENNPYLKYAKAFRSFTIGSSKDEVLKAQGIPTSITKLESFKEEIWRYDNSSITFKNEKVLEYANHSRNLRVKL